MNSEDGQSPEGSPAWTGATAPDYGTNVDPAYAHLPAEDRINIAYQMVSDTLFRAAALVGDVSTVHERFVESAREFAVVRRPARPSGSRARATAGVPSRHLRAVPPADG